LNNLKKVNNVDFITLFNIFVKKFASFKNAKKREISNFIIIEIKNLNNVIKENNNKREIRYKT